MHRSFIRILAILATFALIIFSHASRANAAVDDLRQWTLRFDQPVSFRVATTGCLGTSSYGYSLPTVDYLQSYRTTLKSKADAAGLAGYAFSRETAGGSQVVVDLDSGDARTVDASRSANKGIALCLCDRNLTYRENCVRSSGNLEPLGTPFLAERDGLDRSNDSWTDSVTGYRWLFAHPALNWVDAHLACTGDFSLPPHPVLANASHRLFNSVIGQKIIAADSHVVWSADEFDWYSAMIVFIPRGDAAAEGKQFLHPALCYAPN